MVLAASVYAGRCRHGFSVDEAKFVADLPPLRLRLVGRLVTRQGARPTPIQVISILL